MKSKAKPELESSELCRLHLGNGKARRCGGAAGSLACRRYEKKYVLRGHKASGRYIESALGDEKARARIRGEKRRKQRGRKQKRAQRAGCCSCCMTEHAFGAVSTQVLTYRVKRGAGGQEGRTHLSMRCAALPPCRRRFHPAPTPATPTNRSARQTRPAARRRST